MRQARFLDLLHGLAYRLGLDPTEGDLHDGDARSMTEYLSESYRFCYEFYPWPETIQVEQLTTVASVIGWEDPAADHQTIGQVVGVTLRHPWTDQNPAPYAWRYGNAGIIVPKLAAGDLYVEYQPRCWPFTLTAYDGTLTYAAGDLVYWQGRVYAYTGTVDANEPGAPSTEWAELPIPYYLRDAIIAGAHAAKLMEEGQHSTALLPDQIMEGMLEREMAKLHVFSGRTERFDVTPYAVNG